MTKTRDKIPQSMRFNVFRRDNFTCRYCGRSSPQVTLHCDHAQSVKDGGADTEENLVTACSDCNFGKSSQSVKHEPQKTSCASDGMIGMWGHTFDGRDIQWQFKVIKKLEGAYLCQLFSWLSGDATECVVISAEKLANECNLYISNELMDAAYDKYCRTEHARIKQEREDNEYQKRVQRRADGLGWLDA